MSAEQQLITRYSGHIPAPGTVEHLEWLTLVHAFGREIAVRATTQECRVCHGTGRVPFEILGVFASDARTVSIECWDCDATGIVPR